VDQWPAREEWKVRNLLQKFPHGMFKIGESDSGRKLKVTLREYIEYMLYNRDDSPLYLFESSLEDHKQAHVMMRDYQPPKFF
jgi:histone arginine demethylase JMJD6